MSVEEQISAWIISRRELNCTLEPPTCQSSDSSLSYQASVLLHSPPDDWLLPFPFLPRDFVNKHFLLTVQTQALDFLTALLASFSRLLHEPTRPAVGAWGVRTTLGDAHRVHTHTGCLLSNIVKILVMMWNIMQNATKQTSLKYLYYKL